MARKAIKVGSKGLMAEVSEYAGKIYAKLNIVWFNKAGEPAFFSGGHSAVSFKSVDEIDATIALMNTLKAACVKNKVFEKMAEATPDKKKEDKPVDDLESFTFTSLKSGKSKAKKG